MPIYEYRCGACGHYLDALQKIGDEHLRDCPSCAESALKRLISAPSFRLKGSGWYETDFKSDKERRRNLAETAGEPDKKAAGDGAKAETKPDAKAAEAKSDTTSDSKAKSESKSEPKTQSNSDIKKTATKGKGSEAA